MVHLPACMLKLRQMCYLLACSLFACACACSRFDAGDVRWRPAEIEKNTDKVIALRVAPSWNNQLVTVTIQDGWDFAVIVMYEPGSKVYYIYDIAGKRYFGTTQFGHLTVALSAIPEGSHIGTIESCTSSWSAMLPNRYRNRLETTIKSRRLIRDEDQVAIVCRCEIKEMILPPLENSAEPFKSVRR